MANMITVSRIVLALSLIFINRQSELFMVFYILCGLSDAADGYITHKTRTSSNAGAILDSIADAVFVGVWVLLFLRL